MIIYLVKKYFVLASVLTAASALIPVVSGFMSIENAVSAAILFSGLVSPVVLHFEFRKRHVWPLYNNLRVPWFRLDRKSVV